MPATPKTRIPVTKTAVDALRPRPLVPGEPIADAHYDAFFAAPRGFHVRVYQNERKVFALRYSDRAGGAKPRYRRLILSAFGEITVDQAMRKAVAARQRVATGEQPHEDKAKKAAIPTVADVVADYLRQLERTRKPRYAAEARRLLEKHLTPKTGLELISVITGGSLQRLHASISRTTPIEANRALASISGLCAFAARRGELPSNPATAVSKTPETPRDVEPLTDAQVAMLGEALRQAEQAGDPWQPLAIIRFVFFTGCRRSEAVNLQWAEIDTERARLLFLDSKGTKRGTRRTDRRPLGAPVLELLSDIKARGIKSAFVFPSSVDLTRPYANLDRQWQRIRTAAGLPALRLHDLRHDVASDFGMRYPGAVVQAMAGHANMATTSRYIHAKDDPMTRAADTVTEDRQKRLNAKPLTSLAAKKTGMSTSEDFSPETSQASGSLTAIEARSLRRYLANVDARQKK